MEFRILGPLEVIDRGRRVPLGGAKQRALLAVLLLHPNQVVSTDRLIDSLWGDRPPETAQTALQVHVSQLRKLLGANRILTEPAGYVLRISPDELDLTRFEEFVRATGEDRPSRLREALALWRGAALADFPSEPFAQGEAARLEEMRLAAIEDRIDEDLAVGRHRELVGELEAFVREAPLRERLRAQLMLAFYRSGRQAEALALYRETRRLLVEELGIEPGEELQQLERQILNQDPALAAPPTQPGTTAGPAATETREPREERKIVSVVFADLVGFTSREDVVDPEDVNAMVSPYYVRLRAELERHGGTVERFVGGAVMAVFGAPVAHEDDPERAVRAALAIRDWLAEQGDDLQARIAVNTGQALVRLGANPSEGEGMVVGEVVNTAAGLLQTTPTGGVVVGETTYRATRDTISYEPLEPAAVKRKGMSVPIWLAKGPELARDVSASRTNAPLVGRQNEVALLKQTYARVLRESSVQLVTIVGEPGIGKTRLVGQFRDFVESQPGHPLWRQGRCLSYGEGITFWALGQIVKAQADILESDDPEEASRKLAVAVDAAAGRSDAHWLHSRLAPLVGVPSGLHPAAQEEAFAAWRTFLEGIAARQPLILVIEDLHWADSALLSFLDHLIEWSADVPMLVIGTTRPEIYQRAAAWGGGKRNSTTIALGPLNDEETGRLISDLLARATLPEQIQKTLLERAGGNPLFAEEFVRMLDDRGLVKPRSGSLEIAAGADITVPESVQAVIAARLDTLAPGRKELVHDAAVIGKVFWAGALAAMGHASKESVLTGLHELVRKELVRRARTSSIEDDVEYMFWHVLVRDVAYGQIPRTARARKHVAAAEWIERIAGERVMDHAEFLANHYSTALDLIRASGDAEQLPAISEAAVRFSAFAGDRAIRLDHAQGERYYRQALALLPEDDPWRPKLLVDAAGAGTVAGVGFEQIKAELEESIAAFRAQGDDVSAADALRRLSFAMYGRRESLPLAEEARHLLEDHEPGPELALVYARLAQEYGIASHNKEALEWSEKALPLLERFGLTDEALRTRSGLAAARCWLGDFGALDDLRELAREAVDPEHGYGTHAIANTLNNLAVTEYWFGAGPGATVEALRAAADFASRRGLERPTKWYTGNMADPLYDLGAWEEVLRIHEQIAAWERVRGQSLIGIFASPSAARILAARGSLYEASALVDEFVPRARDGEVIPAQLSALTAAAVVAARQGKSDSALGYVEEFAGTKADVSDLLGYLAEIGRVCARGGDLTPLEQLLGRATDLDPRLDRFVWSGHALLAEAKGEHGHADSLYTRLASAWEEYGCVVEQAHALISLGRCRLALGQGDRAAAPLHEGRAIFARLEARSLVAETDGLVARLAARRS